MNVFPEGINLFPETFYDFQNMPQATRRQNLMGLGLVSMSELEQRTLQNALNRAEGFEAAAVAQAEAARIREEETAKAEANLRQAEANVARERNSVNQYIAIRDAAIARGETDPVKLESFDFLVNSAYESLKIAESVLPAAQYAVETARQAEIQQKIAAEEMQVEAAIARELINVSSIAFNVAEGQASEADLIQAQLAVELAAEAERARIAQEQNALILQLAAENEAAAAAAAERDAAFAEAYAASQAERDAAAAAQAAADQQAAIDVFNRLRQQEAEAEAAALRELEKAQTAAARNFPWFEADMFVNATAEQKAAAYLRYIDMGKSDSEIRSAAQAFFGFQKDADWQLLQEMARQIAIDRAGPIKVTEPPMREVEFTQLATQPATQPAGNAGAIALAALAAALLLGA